MAEGPRLVKDRSRASRPRAQRCGRGRLGTRPRPEETDLDGCLDDPTGLRRPELLDEVIPRGFDRPAWTVERRHEPEVTLHDLAVDQDRLATIGDDPAEAIWFVLGRGQFDAQTLIDEHRPGTGRR